MDKRALPEQMCTYLKLLLLMRDGKREKIAGKNTVESEGSLF